MRRLLLTLLLAVLGALLVIGISRPRTFEQQLLHLQVAQAMPEYAQSVSDEPATLQALLLIYADDDILLAKARLALLRYPHIARPVLLTYGDTAQFQEVLRKYGEDVVLPIHYFYTNEVVTLQLMQQLSDAAQAALGAIKELWPGNEPQASPNNGPLSAEERGFYAIQFLLDEGYDFLGQFVMTPGGQVAWVQTERFLEGVNQFFASGIKGLETRLRQEQSVGAGDIGWAAVDVAIGVSAFKLLRMGKATAAGGRTLTFSQRSAAMGAGLWRGSTIGARLVKYGAPAVLAYMVVRHPSLINSFFVSTADALGVPVYLMQVLGWTLILLPLLFVLHVLLRPLAWLLINIGRALRWGDRALSRRAGAQP